LPGVTVAKSGAAKRAPQPDDEQESRVPSTRRAAGASAKNPVGLDRIIHERVRLAIVSALAGTRSLSFNDLKALLDITDGNLSVHARRLEEAGFIGCRKTFVDRVPHTEYHLTAAGRRALDKYLDHMESLIRRVREA
jgi:DNA-binding HxlR family transcriptional regulator